MRHTTLIIVVVAILVLSGMLVIGMNLQAHSMLEDEAVEYTSPYGYRSGPEWDELHELMSLGSDGWEGLEGLMASTDPYIAQEAAQHLSSSGLIAIDHFLKGFPTIQSSARSYVGGQDYNDAVWQRAVEIVQDQEEDLLEGAAYFLRIENGDMYQTSLTPHEVGDALVASIPEATGVYAEVLPQTLSYYEPGDIAALTGLLKSKTEQDRLIAVRTLGKLGVEETLPNVRELKTDSSKSVRTAAMTAESSIDSAVLAAKTPPVSYSGASPLNEQMRATEREKAKKRLGMP